MTTIESQSLIEARTRALHEAFARGGFEEMAQQARALAVREPDRGFGWQALGVALVQLGESEAALLFLDRALLLDSQDQTIWEARGVALQKLHQHDAALNSFSISIAIDILNSRAYFNRGLTLSAAGERDHALTSFRRALRIEPSNSDIWASLGYLLKTALLSAEACVAYEHALALSPASPKTLSGLGLVLIKEGRFSMALWMFRCALRLDRDATENHCHLGSCLVDMGDLEGAISYLQGVLVAEPSNHKLINSLALALRAGRKSAESLSLIERLIRLRPYSHEAINNRGTILRDMQAYSEALRSLQTAVIIKPDFVEALTNLGTALMEVREVLKAIDYFERAFILSYANWSALWNASLGYLSLGVFDKGWGLHEHRFSAGAVVDPRIGGLSIFNPRDDGKSRVLVCSEQGIGDAIMFGSMITDFRSLVGTLVIKVDPRLRALFRRSLPKDVVVVPSDEPLEKEAVDSQLPMGSLGMYVRKNHEDFSASRKGYLRADPLRVAELHASMHRDHPFVVGLSWRSANTESAALRNIELTCLLKMLKDALPTASFVNLQYGDTATEILHAARRTGVNFLESQVTELDRNLDDVAALVSACDVVVTIGNTTAHLCGSLGKTAAVLLPYASSWRWMAAGSRTPWYSSLMLFRKSSPTTTWEEVIDEAARFVSDDYFMKGRLGSHSSAG
jgi:tetratricopeptide (TPR) repeat protein